MAEELDFKFRFIQINLNVNSNTWLVATILDNAAQIFFHVCIEHVKIYIH